MSTSFRKAVNEKCKQCVYDPLAGGTWLKQVEECGIATCPLHPIRPRTRASRAESVLDASKAIFSGLRAPDHVGAPGRAAAAAMAARAAS